MGAVMASDLTDAKQQAADLRKKAIEAAYGVAAGSQAEANLYPGLQEQTAESFGLSKKNLRTQAAQAIAGGLEKSGRMAAGGGFLAAGQDAARQVAGQEAGLEAQALQAKTGLETQGAAAQTAAQAQLLEAAKFEKEAKGDIFKKLADAQNNAYSIVQGYKGTVNDDEDGAANALDDAANASEDPEVAAFYRQKAKEIRDGDWDF